MKVRLKKTVTWVYKTCRIIVLFLILLVISGWYFLQTDFAREEIRKMIVTGVSDALQQRVELSTINGQLPFSIQFDRFSISDENGTWLRVDGFEFSWKVSELFAGTVALEKFAADYVCVERIPDFNVAEKTTEEEKSSEKKPFKLPAYLPALDLNRIQVGCLRLGEALVGMDAEFSIFLKGGADRKGMDCSLEVRRTDGLVDNLSFEFVLTNQWAAGSVDLEFQEGDGGLISVLAGEKFNPVRVNLSGHGAVTNWLGTCVAKVGSVTNEIGLLANYCFVDSEQFRLEWSLLQEILPGRVRGSIQLDAPLSSPVIAVDAFLEQLQLSSLVQMPLQAMNVQVRADYVDKHIQAYLSTDGLPQCRIHGNAHIPAHLALYPFVLNVGEDSPVDGELSGNLDLSIVAPLLQTFQQNVKGNIASQVKLAGTLGEPDVEGFIKMDDALYENLKIGMLLRNIDLDAALNKNRLQIRNFTAEDTAQGRLRLTGAMTFGEDQNESLDFHFVMNNAQLVNQTLVSASASADIRIKGDHQKIMVAGTSTIERVLVNLQETLPPDVTEIKVIEVNKPGGKRANRTASKKEGPESAKHMQLDIALKAPGHIFVNGRGLTSEWKADMYVGGDASMPRITGGLAVVRGYFVFLGKRLQLDQCSVTFDGSWPVIPSVDIRASTVSGDIVAGIRIYGPVTAPQFQLHSEPSRPEDEILSLMLFGKRPDELSATEALKIAYGLNVLRGGFGANGFLARTQKSLGVDQIGVRQGDNDQTQLTVGKYIGKYIYIEGEKSLQGEGDAVKVDFNVTRNIQLKTKASSEQGEGSSVYLRWHTDY